MITFIVKVITFIVKVITPGMRWCLNINVLHVEASNSVMGNSIGAKKRGKEIPIPKGNSIGAKKRGKEIPIPKGNSIGAKKRGKEIPIPKLVRA